MYRINKKAEYNYKLYIINVIAVCGTTGNNVDNFLLLLIFYINIEKSTVKLYKIMGERLCRYTK